MSADTKSNTVLTRRNKHVISIVCITIGLILLSLTSQLTRIWSWKYKGSYSKTPMLNYHRRNWGGSGFKGGLLHSGSPNKTLIILGDSHAGMLDTGIVKLISLKNNITTYSLSGGGAGKYMSCLSLPGITRISKKQQREYDRSCRQEYLDALSLYKTNKNITFILSYAYSTQYKISGSSDKHIPFSIGSNHQAKYEELIKGLDTFVKDAKNAKIIIMGNTPGSSYIPEKCLGQSRFTKHVNYCQNRDPINRKIDSIEVNIELKKYANHTKNVYFIDPYGAFCNNSSCSTQNKKGQPFYSDGSHLSKSGSIHLIDYYSELINKTINSVVT